MKNSSLPFGDSRSLSFSFNFRSLKLPLCAFTLAASAACSTVSHSQVDQTLAKRVDEIANAALVAGPYPGIAISISNGGETVFEGGYGLANIEFDAPVKTDTVFAIGSVTKSFTALAIAQLASAGKLSLDDPISDYLEDLPQNWNNIRIKHLLNHTSGIFNYTQNPEIHRNPARHYNHDEMRSFFENVPLAFEPGTQFSYTNSGTYLLGVIIEKISGMTYGEYLQHNIFAPFDMTASSYPDFSQIIKGRAAGYVPGENGFLNAEPYSATIPFSAGALLSTLADLEKYAEAVHQSDAVSDEVREILYTHAVLEDGKPLQYALGSLIIRDDGGRKKISHSGDIFGYSSHFAHYPAENVTISVLTNNQKTLVHPSSIEHKLARAIFGEPDPEIVNLPVSPEEIANLTGDYSTAPIIFGVPILGIVERNGGLALAFGGVAAAEQAIPLLHQGDLQFVFAFDSEVKLSFSTEEGNPAFDLFMYDGKLTAKSIGE